MLASFGSDGPLTLALPDPESLRGAVEALLDDPDRRATLADRAIASMSLRTWEHAAEQVADGLRTALQRPDQAAGRPASPR
jgi:glycosyltransferase involved in cell wall biosynthesis